jgi:hypothetical protein
MESSAQILGVDLQTGADLHPNDIIKKYIKQSENPPQS